MLFVEFINMFSSYPVIPVIEIEKAFPDFDHNALTRWQKKGYLEKVRSGFYRLASLPISGEIDRFFIANRIYAPSYISLQSALWWYGFIPEGVFTVTSVTTRKTENFQTPAGHFTYRSIRRDLFFGYRMEKKEDFGVKMADPAKALLDMLYLHPHLDSADHFFEWRLNFWELKKKLSLQDFQRYLQLFASKSLEERAKNFIQFLNNHDVSG